MDHTGLIGGGGVGGSSCDSPQTTKTEVEATIHISVFMIERGFYHPRRTYIWISPDLAIFHKQSCAKPGSYMFGQNRGAARTNTRSLSTQLFQKLRMNPAEAAV